MAKFHFKVKGSVGSFTPGIVEAKDKDEALQNIYDVYGTNLKRGEAPKGVVIQMISASDFEDLAADIDEALINKVGV